MFKKTITFSMLKSSPELMSEIKHDEVYQVIHRGQEIKVVMTQEHYFRLLALIERAQPSPKTTPFDADRLASKSREKTEKLKKMMDKDASGQ